MPAINRAHAFSSRSTARPRQRHPDWNEPDRALCHEGERRRRPGSKTQKQTRPRRSFALGTTRPWQLSTVLMWGILVGLLLCCSGAEAEYVQVAKALEPGRSALLFDRSEPPIPAPRVRLERRQEQESVSATPSFIPAPTAAGQESASLFGIPTATGAPREDLPSPFDTSLGNNFTSPSCPAFFQSFLSNATFQDCLPFSLLLQTSNAFFTTTRSAVALTRTLDATCAVPSLPTCINLMTDLATRIQDPSTCGADFALQNPQVRQAYAGFLAYQPLYHAGCLTDRATGEYCFAQAVGNATAASASYIYYLPLGVSLPGTAAPGCGACLRDTMAVFALYAGDQAQPLSATYAPAAAQLDGSCGSRFVEAARASVNAAARSVVAGFGFWYTLVVMFFFAVV